MFQPQSSPLIVGPRIPSCPISETMALSNSIGKILIHRNIQKFKNYAVYSTKKFCTLQLKSYFIATYHYYFFGSWHSKASSNLNSTTLHNLICGGSIKCRYLSRSKQLPAACLTLPVNLQKWKASGAYSNRLL